jgi:glycosyltransferase involved in cell wall biosynthesis
MKHDGSETRATLRTPPPGVTVVIPNWNHEYFLPRSIHSALKAIQALGNAGVPGEVLVIDDDSRDGSLTLLRQLEALYYDQGLRVLALSENIGLPRARNRALHEAHYRYLIYLDADNELLWQNMPLFYKAIQQTHAAVVYGNLLHQEYAEGNAVRVSNNQSFRPQIFSENYIDACALYDRAQIFDVGGYASHPNLHGYEDWELFLHLAANGRLLVFVPLVFGTYYVNPGSMLDEIRELETYQHCRAYIQRIYDQIGLRQRHLINTRHLRFHPDIGYF